MLVRETISFERKKDPKEALGLDPVDALIKIIAEIQDDPLTGDPHLRINTDYSKTISIAYWGSRENFNKLLKDTKFDIFISSIEEDRPNTRKFVKFLLNIKDQYSNLFYRAFNK